MFSIVYMYNSFFLLQMSNEISQFALISKLSKLKLLLSISYLALFAIPLVKFSNPGLSNIYILS